MMSSYSDNMYFVQNCSKQKEKVVRKIEHTVSLFLFTLLAILHRGTESPPPTPHIHLNLPALSRVQEKRTLDMYVTIFFYDIMLPHTTKFYLLEQESVIL